MAVIFTDYLRPRTLKEGLILLSRRGSPKMIIGGGVSIVLSGAPRKMEAVDFSRAGLDRIERKGDQLKIGAMATFSDMLRSPDVGEICGGVIPPALRTAATIPIRNLITVGGNITQCYYWSTLPPLLLALEAKISIVSSKGRRLVGADWFFEEHPRKRLGSGEMVDYVEIPEFPRTIGKRSSQSKSSKLSSSKSSSSKLSSSKSSSSKSSSGSLNSLRWGAAFLKCSQTANDYAWVNVCVVLGMDQGVVKDVRMTIGAISTLTQRCSMGEEFLIGKTLDEKMSREVGQLSVEHLVMRDDIRSSREYRKQLSAVYLERALMAAAAQAGGVQ